MFDLSGTPSKDFFHTNLVLTITYTQKINKNKSAKSVKPFSSDALIFMSQLIFIWYSNNNNDNNR